jgi:Zn-dependent protease
MGHGIAGLLGIPTVPIATILISYHLSKKQEWFSSAKTMKLIAHGTWISLVLMVVAMFVMMSGFQNAGIQMGPDSPPPSHVPDGVIAVVGYVNRLLILVDIFWLIYVAKAMQTIHNN